MELVQQQITVWKKEGVGPAQIALALYQQDRWEAIRQSRAIGQSITLNPGMTQLLDGWHQIANRLADRLMASPQFLSGGRT